MPGKKTLLVITSSYKKILWIAASILTVIIAANAILFASINGNVLSGKNILIDPGHGGIDGGTNDNETFFEKDINLQLAKKVQKLLQSEGAFVSLTRETDVSLDDQNSLSSSRHQRDLLARVTQFNSGKYDIFVSVHVNRSSSSRAIGPMVLYSPRLPQNILLSECMQKRLNTHIKKNLNSDVSHNTIKSDYFILKNANIPGILVESGFISNTAEKRLLMDESFQEKLAEAICSGIKDYFTEAPEKLKDIQTDDTENGQESIPFNIINEVRLVFNRFVEHHIIL